VENIGNGRDERTALKSQNSAKGRLHACVFMQEVPRESQTNDWETVTRAAKEVVDKWKMLRLASGLLVRERGWERRRMRK